MTLDELLTIWRSRDDHYATRRNELDDDAIASVRTWREDEARDLESGFDVSRAAAEARMWSPPPRMR